MSQPAEVSAVERVGYAGKRIIIRTARLAVGLALLGCGIASCSTGMDELGRPLGGQSLLGLLGGLFFVGLAAALFGFAWGAAFGAGPPRRS